MQDYSIKRILFKALWFFIIALFFFISPVWAASTYSKIVKTMAKSIASDIAETGKTRIAVAKILSADKKAYPFGLLMAEKLTTGLIQEARGRYSVLERAYVDRIMGELVELTAEKAQQLLKADILVTGTYAIFKDKVDLSIRAIDLSTGKAIAATYQSISREKIGSELPWPTHQDPKDKLTLNLQILMPKYIDGIKQEIVLKNGTTLHSGDEFKIHFKAEQDLYMYVICYNSSGTVRTLFPHPKIALNNFIRGRVPYTLPGGKQLFTLDDNRGVETLYFLASLEPIIDIDLLLAKMENADSKGKKGLGERIREAIGTRDIGISAPTSVYPTDNRDGAMEVIKGHGSFLRVIEFQHQ